MWIIATSLIWIKSFSGRADDNFETIKKRLQTFNNATAPVVKHYQSKGKLVHVNL